MLYENSKKVLSQFLQDIKQNKAELLEVSKHGFLYRVSFDNNKYLAVTDINHHRITDVIPDNPEIQSTDRKFTDLYYIRYLVKQYKIHLFNEYHIKARHLSCEKCKSKHVIFNLKDFTLHCTDCKAVTDLTEFGNVQIKLYNIEPKEQVKQCIQLSNELHAMLYSMATELTLTVHNKPCIVKAKDENLFDIIYGDLSLTADKNTWLTVTSLFNLKIISDAEKETLYDIRETLEDEEGLIE